MFSEGFRQLKTAALDERELTARWLLLHLARRHGGQWLSSPRAPRRGDGPGGFNDLLNLNLGAKARTKLENFSSAREVFEHYYLRGVVRDAHEGFVGWSEGRYPLLLLHRIPSPEEMLDVQCEGRRYVTLRFDEAEQLTPYGRHADAAAFCLHDFEHAHKFFGSDTFVAQRRFFQLLRRNLERLEGWGNDQRFRTDLDYLKSDMNSHPVHLLKFLKAIVLNAAIRATGAPDPRLEEFWEEFFAAWEMNSDARAAAMNLNQPGVESVKDQVRAYDFFATEARG